MRKYIDSQTGEKIVEISDISFLENRNHPYNWLQRHYYHFRLKIWLRNVDRVLVSDDRTAFNVSRYYFVPKEKISVSSHKA